MSKMLKAAVFGHRQTLKSQEFREENPDGPCLIQRIWYNNTLKTNAVSIPKWSFFCESGCIINLQADLWGHEIHSFSEVLEGTPIFAVKPANILCFSFRPTMLVM